MNTIYKKVPCTNEFTFDNEESFICPLHTTQQEEHQKFPIGKKTRRNHRNLERFGKYFLTQPKQNEEMLEDCEQEEVTPFNFFKFFSQMEQKPWFTVIPLGVMVRPEEVKVKLNPLCRLLVIKATPLMRNYRSRTATGKQIHRIVTLPKNIRMEKLQVKLTPRGELVVMAPFKIQQGQETLTRPFFEESRDLFSTLKWITIPIINYRETIRNKKRQQPFFPFQGESETSSSSSSSSEESSTDESETESETSSSSEEETSSETEEMFPLRHRQQRQTGIRGNLQVQVQQYVQLLQKIFFPNVVVAKIIRGETSTQQVLVSLDVKFVDFRAEDIKVRMPEIKRRLLIVEAKKVRQYREPHFGSFVKYVRREFELPQWLDVKRIVYRVLPTGVLRIKLPLLTTNVNTNTFTGVNTFPLQHRGISQQFIQRRGETMGCPCKEEYNNFFTVQNKRCPEYKKYQQDKRGRAYFF